ncbi:MAG TPA: L-idonate 5-dehydrogenase, partial [Hyphomicrobiaceae bacterium]|nr:L-idonate 5-dehydrogenase [Hyphomicrobiaceae bacterium]
YYHDGRIGTAIVVREPMVLGHEVAGRIEALGAGVTSVKVGDRVALNPSRPCGACRYCQAGLQMHCLDMRFYGSAMRFPHVQGAFRDAIVAEAGQCHVVPESLSAGEAAMAEPLAVCLHAARRAGPLLGRKVIVTGSGPIGALCAIAARRAGASLIVATDISDAPRVTLEKLGVDRFVNVAKDKAALADYAKDKGTFDVAFEASGAAPAVAAAIDVLKPCGIIVQVGLGGEMALPMNAIVAKEIEVRGTFRFHEEYGLATELLGKRLVDVRPLITATLPVEKAVEAFGLASDRGRSMKVQLSFA